MTQRSWLTVQVIRLLATGLLMAATFAGDLRPAVAQDSESGVEDNTYTGPSYGWSVEWDEDVWEVAEENNEDDSDFLVLQTLDGETPVAYTRFWATDDLFDDPEECAEGWEERIADAEGNEDVELTEEYDVPPAPRGGATATYTYTFDDGSGNTHDNVEHFQCQYIEEGGPLLIVWIFADEADFEDAIPLYEDLVDAIVIPEDGGDDDGQADQDNENVDGEDEGTQDDEGTDDEGADEDEGTQDDEGADTGIDGPSYTSPTYGYTVEWDDDVWTADPDAELVGNGTEGLDRLYLAHSEGDDLFSGLYVEGKVAYDGDLDDCLDEEADILRNDDALTDFEPYEDDEGDPVAGESDAGGEYATYLGEYEDENGEAYELLWYVECQILDDNDAPVIFTLFTSEANYEDELDLAQDVIDSLETDSGDSPNDDSDTDEADEDEPADDEEPTEAADDDGDTDEDEPEDEETPADEKTAFG